MIDLATELQTHARERELSARGRSIEQRMEWDALQRVDRLEHAVEAARERLRLATLRAPASPLAGGATR